MKLNFILIFLISIYAVDIFAQQSKTISNRATNQDLILETTGGSLTIDGTTGNISAPNFAYQTDTYAADGDLTSGNFIAVKQGNMVTIMCDSQISHGNFSAPQSTVGLIGADYRPSSNTVANTFDASGSRVMVMRVQTDGRIRFEYYDWAGTPVTNTNTNTACSVTYYVP